MKTIFAIVAVVSLLGAVALVPVIGGPLVGFALVGLAGLALTGVLSSLEDTSVPQRDPSMDATRWRNGSPD
jgi:hypothetical protein